MVAEFAKSARFVALSNCIRARNAARESPGLPKEVRHDRFVPIRRHRPLTLRHNAFAMSYLAVQKEP